MTAFHFRLDKVLSWRQRQLELAETDFRREAGALAELDRVSAELEADGIRAEVEVRDWRPLEGRDLAALSGFRVYLERRANQLAAQRAEQSRKLAEREQVMLEARRRCRLLERLRERRLAEWKAASAAELEQTASESHLARIARQSSIMNE
jgi:hypothetical protein